MPRKSTTPTATTTPATASPTVESNPEPQPAIRTSPTNGEVKLGEIKSSVRSVIDQIDSIKESLKTVVRQFGDVVDALRQLEKEKKTNDKEVEGVREKLRAIQSVSI